MQGLLMQGLSQFQSVPVLSGPSVLRSPPLCSKSPRRKSPPRASLPFPLATRSSLGAPFGPLALPPAVGTTTPWQGRTAQERSAAPSSPAASTRLPPFSATVSRRSCSRLATSCPLHVAAGRGAIAPVSGLCMDPARLGCAIRRPTASSQGSWHGAAGSVQAQRCVSIGCGAAGGVGSGTARITVVPGGSRLEVPEEHDEVAPFIQDKLRWG